MKKNYIEFFNKIKTFTKIKTKKVFFLKILKH